MGLGGGCGVATNLGSPYLGLGVYLGFPHLGLSLHTLQSARTFCATVFFAIFCSHTPSKTTNKCDIIINMSSLFRGLIERGERWGALLRLAQLGVSSKVMWLANARSVVYLQK